MVWIGPSPEAIEALGDKVTARHVAEKVGAPLAPGTPDPVETAEEVVAFAEQVGLPIAIKAAFGGGGRGLKVARELDEVAEMFESATREAVAAFGRGECFVEKYLDKPRHVETQCLADAEGNVVVVSTRDCSLQRRHQKLVEEAPAPFLTDEQNARCCTGVEGDPQGGRLRRRRHLRVPDRRRRHRLLPRGEHPAAGRAPGLRGGHRDRPGPRAVPHRRGRPLDYDDPLRRATRSSSGSTARTRVAASCPSPARSTSFKTFGGPGIRLDSGVTAGDEVSGAFDSLLAKIIVTGKDRAEALERSRRALDEFEVPGLPTVLPFHRKVVNDPAFTAEDGRFGVYTRWIETEFVNDIPAWDGELEAPPSRRAGTRSSSRSPASASRSACPTASPPRSSAPAAAPPRFRRRAAATPRPRPRARPATR